MRLPVVITSAVVAVLASGVAVQQRSVAAHWRDLEHDRAAAVSTQLQSQAAELDALRRTRTDLQGRLDALAADRATTGDQADEITVLADRGKSVQLKLAACTTGISSPDTACADAAFEASQILAALNRVAQQ